MVNISDEAKESALKKMLAGLRNFYDKQHMKMLAVTFIIFILAILQIGYQVIKTGDFINKDVSLKGGTTLTVLTEKQVDINEFGKKLKNIFPDNDVSVRKLESAGKSIGIAIAVDFKENENDKINSLIAETGKEIGKKLSKEDYTIEMIGSSLGTSFFRQMFFSIIIAFILMSIVVFIYFRSFYPSIAVVLAALCDIIETVAVANIIGMKIGPAGIASLLMLIGYSVDTDILLTARVLKKTEGTVLDRIIDSTKTGIMMNLTAVAAIIVALIFTQSDVIKQIMTIMLFGLIFDNMNTWIQNAGILRIYMKIKHKEH